MSAARDASECQRLGRWLTAYVDDELDAVHTLEVEDHLGECEDCREYLTTLRATRTSLQEVASMRAPLALRERIEASLAAEGTVRTEGAEASGEAPPSPTSQVEPSAAVRAVPTRPRRPARRDPIGLRYVVPLAAAATVALVLGVVQLQQREESTAKQGPEDAASASVQGASLDNLLEDLVAWHAHPPPPETTDPDGLEQFDPYVGVRVRKPRFDQVDARYIGARMQHRAALLQYVVRDRHRVTVYVFNPKQVPLKATRLQKRKIGERQVYVGNVRGYSVAASERNGIGWALASDLNDQENAELVLSAAR
ncbi:MAG: zf-HC2 domain-containing protein [Deltaproteobacteria bacterium]|nr:zf-HC2 domain-containing protein [Deltaproteobacteria bacterium]